MAEAQTTEQPSAPLSVSEGASALAGILSRASSRLISDTGGEPAPRGDAPEPMRQRDQTGRFAAAAQERQEQNTEPEPPAGEPADAGEKEPVETSPAEEDAPAPETWADDVKPHFKALPGEARKALREFEAKRAAEIETHKQEAAKRAQAADAERQAMALERQRYAEGLSVIQKQANAELQQLQGVDWDKLLEQDPVQYMKLDRRRNDLIAADAQAQKEREQIAAQSQQESAKRRAEFIAREHERLTTKLVPEWKDPAKFQAGAREVAEYLAREGVAKEQIADITDATSISIARKAMLYDRLMAERGNVTKRVEAAPKVIKPGVPRDRGASATDAVAAARARHAREGSIASAAGVLRAMAEAGKA